MKPETKDDDLLSHSVDEHDESKPKKDHYHNEHHFDKQGNHDDVSENDFKVKTSIYTSKRNLIYRISLTGVFLALATAATALDMIWERLNFLYLDGGILIPTRFVDILIISISIATIGPAFASFLGLSIPWIHLIIDPHHGPLSALIDSMGYCLMVWVLWVFYYVIFKNSYIHKEPNKKKNIFKIWMPLPFYVILGMLIYVPLTIAIIYVTTEAGHLDNHSHLNFNIYHRVHDHHHWEDFQSRATLYSFIIGGVQAIRFTICYVTFALIEPQMKKINHRYR